MLLETMVQVHGNFGTILSTSGSMLASSAQAAGAALFQKIGNFQTTYASSSSASVVDQRKFYSQTCE